MPINNILDLIGEGIRETNPIYRQKMEQQRAQQARMAEIAQQQLFQTQQRQTPSTYEKFQMDRETQNHADLLKQQQITNEEHAQDRVSKGLWKETDQYGSDLEPGQSPAPPTSPAQRAVASPAMSGPPDAATNGTGGAGGSGVQGALTPTSATGSVGSPGGVESGGGPSAPSIAALILPPNFLQPPTQPQGPLTGAPGGAPQGNAVATTQASRASSAQAGPLAQLSQGSVTPSQTAAGQTGHDSGVLPAADPNRVAAAQAIGFKPIEVNGHYYRATTPDEQNEFTRSQARIAAAQDRENRMSQANALLQDPRMAAAIKANPNLAPQIIERAMTGSVVAPETSSQKLADLQSQLDQANQSGDTGRADQIRTEILAGRPGTQQATLSPPALAAAAKRFAMTGQMPPGMGRNGIMSAEIQDASSRLFPNEDVAKNSSFYAANKKSMATQIPTFDAIDQYERTAKDNIDNSLPLLQKVVDSGVPWINSPLRTLNVKALGDADIPAYNAASLINSNEIARILSMASQNPGVLSDASRAEAQKLLNAQNSTPAQILKTYTILRQDMANRRAEAGQQIQNIGARTGASMNDLREWYGSEAEPPTPGTTDVRNGATAPPTPTPSPAKLADAATITKYLKDNGGDKVKARRALTKDGYTIPPKV